MQAISLYISLPLLINSAACTSHDLGHFWRFLLAPRTAFHPSACSRLPRSIEYTASIDCTSFSAHTGLLAPVFMKRSVDALSGAISRVGVRACVIALLSSGLCRVVNSVAREAQGPVFTPVAQVSLLLAPEMRAGCPLLSRSLQPGGEWLHVAVGVAISPKPLTRTDGSRLKDHHLQAHAPCW